MDVEYLRFVEIVIAGVRFDRDVIVERGRVGRRTNNFSRASRDRFRHIPRSADGEIPWSAPGLMIGSGADGCRPEGRHLAEAGGMKLVESPTVEAAGGWARPVARG